MATDYNDNRKYCACKGTYDMLFTHLINGVRTLPLTAKQKDLIILMDNQAKQILKHGDDEALLMSLAHKMHQIKDIMDSASEDELNSYCQQYDGFYQYMKLLERMALASSQGAFDDLIK